VPSGAVWSLPVYELALMTAAWLAARGIVGVGLALVTPEDEPLGLFGHEASLAIQALLDERGIVFHGRSHPVEARDGKLLVVPESVVAADRVVATPRLQGQRIEGIPQTADSFIPVDTHARVTGVSDVYAAGDITSFPVKQGGIAAQQAEVAAEAIAAEAGADLTPRPFRPVLRGLLLTGMEPSYLRRELTKGEETSWASSDPLWWPPAKIVGHYLAPFLGALAGVEVTREMPSRPGTVQVHVALDPDHLGIGLGL
jgi:sulfide:quinone oxidoreductase